MRCFAAEELGAAAADAAMVLSLSRARARWCSCARAVVCAESGDSGERVRAARGR